jgi:hypothetical protein
MMWMSVLGKECHSFWKGLVGLITQRLRVSVNEVWNNRNGDQIDTRTKLMEDDVRQELSTGLKVGTRYDEEHC